MTRSPFRLPVVAMAASVAGRLGGPDSGWDFLEVEPESFGLRLETE
jgi:hypothetical protein